MSPSSPPRKAGRLPLRVPPALHEALMVIAGFTLLTAVMTFPLIARLSDSLPGLRDPVLLAWTLAWDADRLAHGLEGLWDAPIFFPHANTLAFSEHLLGIAVLTAPLQWLTGNPVLVYNAAFFGSYVLAGAGTYLLSKSLTGSRLAAALAGIAVAFGPYRATQAAHLQVLMSGWMPIALWALHRYFASGSRRALSGFVGAFLLLGLSNGYFLYFFAIPVVIVVTSELPRRRHQWRRLTAEISVAALLGLAVLAPIGSAYYRAREDLGLVRSRADIVSYSADVLAYTQVDRRSSPWSGVLNIGDSEEKLFPGLTVLVLACVALGLPRRDARATAAGFNLSSTRQVVLYTGIGVAAFIFSLGPEPAWAGRPLLMSGPYDWLLAFLPGFDGLRVPARMATIVYLALGILAGIGMGALLSVWSHPIGVAVWAICFCALLVEGYGGALPLERFPPTANDDELAAYAWLRESPPGGIVNLPFLNAHLSARPVQDQFFALRHGHPIVNGYSGYRSLLAAFLSEPGSPLQTLANAASTVQALRQLGVRHIVVHAAAYPDLARANAAVAAIANVPAQVEQRRAFGSTVVFRLTRWNRPPPDPPAALRAVSQERFRPTSSRAPYRLPLAFDGDPDTRWLTARRQTGDEWIQLEFDAPRNVGLVRLAMARRSLGDYPRRLRIESSSDGTTFQTLFQGIPLAQFLRGLVRNRVYPTIDIALPSNRTRLLRIRQIGRTRSFYWSVHELGVFER
ncbi:MAG: discoidin domain-containing protein [Vicinamibacterales bacterium]|nr:discoidin domain-containing protein [Vicinamibacterales bacterium]